MILLLDTQVLRRSVEDDRRLGPIAPEALSDLQNELLVSNVSLWEIATKARLGKLAGDVDRLLTEMPALSMRLLDLQPAHLRRFLALPRPARHRDPFDQLLLAQAAAEQAIFVTADRALSAYGIALQDATA